MRSRPSLCSTLLVSLFLLGACAAPAAIPAPLPPNAEPTSSTGTTTLTVFAASSLTAAFNDIGKAFEAANPGTKVAFNFAGSQDLRTQIEQGARADLFASADTKTMDALEIANMVRDPQVFAHNRLVVIVPKADPVGVKEFKDLAKPGLKLDIADASVPVGNYTLQTLDKISADAAYGADFKTNVLAQVVSKENNVKQVVSKVSLGEADAGVVYATDAQAAAATVLTIDIPDKFNVLATYPIAVLKTSAQPQLAQQFLNYVLSPNGQKALKSYGFGSLILLRARDIIFKR